MKKIMTMAAVALFASTAFAQNPDALKQIKKAKTAAEVTTLVSANASSMSAAEKAQAYNKLVDLALKTADPAMQAIMLGQDADKDAFYNDLVTAFQAALECDKYDVQPNDKGKVAPKFRKSNADRLFTYRSHLINAGQDAQASDPKKAGDMFDLYVATGVSELFAERVKTTGDEYLSEVARVAALNAFNNGDAKKALGYADLVMSDPNKEKDGLNLKLYFLEKNAKTRQDSLQCIEEYKVLFEKYPNDNDVFSQLAQMYANTGQTDKQNEIVEARLKSDPKNFSAWALKGQTLMNSEKYDEAIACYDSALGCEVEEVAQHALINTFVGYCYNQKAAALDNYDDQLAALKKAIPYLEKAREQDPGRERSNWAYPLYNCYYHVKGENDAATLELKQILGL